MMNSSDNGSELDSRTLLQVWHYAIKIYGKLRLCWDAFTEAVLDGHKPLYVRIYVL